MKSPGSSNPTHSMRTKRRPRTRSMGRGGRRRSRKRQTSRRIRLGNDTPNEDAKSILRETARRSTRRDKERTRTRKKRGSTRKIDPESPNRTQQHLLRKETHKIPKRANRKRTRKQTDRRLSLSTKPQQIREKQVIPRRRHLSRKSLKLLNPTNGSQRQQIKNFPCKVPKKARRQELKRRTAKERENQRQVPRRNPRGRKRVLQAERAEKISEHKVRRQLRKNETENNAQYRAVRSYRRVGKGQRATQIQEKGRGMGTLERTGDTRKGTWYLNRRTSTTHGSAPPQDSHTSQ